MAEILTIGTKYTQTCGNNNEDDNVFICHCPFAEIVNFVVIVDFLFVQSHLAKFIIVEVLPLYKP